MWYGCCVSVLCQWGNQVNPTKDREVNSQLLCPSVSAHTGIHLAVRRPVMPHRKTLMDPPSILPFLLSLSAFPPPSVCHLLHPSNSLAPYTISHTEFTSPLHLLPRSCFGCMVQGVACQRATPSSRKGSTRKCVFQIRLVPSWNMRYTVIC